MSGSHRRGSGARARETPVDIPREVAGTELPRAAGAVRHAAAGAAVGTVDRPERPAAPVAGPLGDPLRPSITPTPNRRAARQEQRRQAQRRRRLITFILAGVAAVAVCAGLLVTLRGGDSSAGGTPAAAGRTQSTVLLMVTGSGGKAVESALLAHDPATGQGAVVLVPSSMVTDVPGRGQLPFGDVAAFGGQMPAETLGDVMGVTVDGTLLVSRTALATLVDRSGGVTVSRVDTDVVQSLPRHRERLVVEHGGEQHLTGEQAVAYATYRTSGENEQARLARLTTVLAGLVAAMPDAGRATTALDALGGALRSTLPAAKLGSVLAGLHGDDAKDNLAYEVLPVQPVGTGDDLYAPSTAEISQLVHRYLAASIPPGRAGGHNRVIVVNGTGALGLGETAHARLDQHGLVFVHSENQQGFSFRDRPSVVLVADDSSAARALGHRVAAALGLPDRDIAINQQPATAADAVVILGADYHP